MKAILRSTLLIASICILTVTVAMAQRVVKGTVYMDGEPAAGVTIEVHKGGSMMTSFDGIYEVEADAKSKWIKFTFIDETKRLIIEGKAGDIFDFPFTGEIPSGETKAAEGGGVVLKSAEELLQDQNQEFMTEYSLYTEFYKQNEYNSAIPHYEVLYTKFPKSTLNLYIQGVKMYVDFIEKAGTDEEKDKLLDKLMEIYDQRVEHFGQKGYVLGRKGKDWFEYKLVPDKRKAQLEDEALKEAVSVAHNYLTESVTLQGDETEPPVLLLFMRTTRTLFKYGELAKETVVNNYEMSNKILNSFIAKSDNEAAVKEVKEIVQPYIENLFSTSGAADCEALVNILTPQFQEKGDDPEFIKEMLRRLRKAKCDESELVEQATEKLYQLEPSAEAAFNMARRYLNRDETDKAKEYYKQAMEQETDQDLLATYYYEYGTFVFIKEDALSEARNYARQALAINPDYCEAYSLIANIYVAAASKFSGSGLEKAAVFWLVVDYFNKARRGEDCAVESAQKAASFKRYYPNKEDAFMEGLQEGQTYKVEGWINENTKVRF